MTLACHVSEVAKPGDYVNLMTDDDHAICVTNFDGELIAWPGLCSHRGYRIYGDTTHGNGMPKCGYHGRTQGPDVRGRMDLTVVDGWVFVGWPVPERLFCTMPDLTLFRSTSYVYPARSWIAIENTLEADHVPFVHKDSLHKLGITSRSVELHPGCFSSTEFYESAESHRLDKLGALFPNAPQDFKHDYIHSFLAPDSCLSSTRGWTFSLQNYFQRADGKTNFVHRLYVTESLADASFFESVWRLNTQVFEEDAAIVARVPAHFRSRAERHELRIRHSRGEI